MLEILQTIQTIRIGGVVATFLFNNGRIIKAVDILNECLVLLNGKALETVKELTTPLVISVYHKLFHGYTLIYDHTRAVECGKKLHVILHNSGQKEEEGMVLHGIANIYYQISKYKEAKQFYEKALGITIQVGNNRGVGICYRSLGSVFQSIGQYTKAEEYLQKALVIMIEIGDKEGEAATYGSLGSVFKSVGQYTKAEGYIQKALVIRKEIGDKKGEATAYGNLGTVFRSVGRYTKAEEYLQKALVIRKEIGNKEGEAADYGNLGTVFRSVGQYTKAEEYLQKALVIRKEIGDKRGEATAYGNLGSVFSSVGQYTKAEEYLQTALVINKEIGDQNGVASAYGNLGSVFHSVGQHTKAEECLQKALAICKEIGDKAGVGALYLQLGKLCSELQLNAKSQEFANKALEISYEIGDIELQFDSHLTIALNALVAGGITTEVRRNLYESIQKCEEMHDFLKVKDQFKISFFDKHVSPYLHLCGLLIAKGSYYEALYVAELGRSRALTDVLSETYSVDKGVSVNPQSWIGIENIMNKNSLSSCLFVFCFDDDMCFWILKPNKIINFRQKTLQESTEKLFGNRKFGGSPDLRQDQCEDRSLFSCVSSPPSCKPSQSDSFEFLRLVEEEEDENHDSKPLTLADGYNMIVAPVADLLQQSEIIIVPDNLLYPIPFAALMDDNGKYLSDTFRIRIVPSLTTLKLIQLSPVDYHSKTGALIVGESEVSDVYYQGKLLQLNSLPWARKEAEMIGRLLGVQPLLGRDATKQAVLKSMHSVSLIHFAAHGYAERGEIALSPISSCGTPNEEDYLLTMAEISQVRLTAKLVVLSCCHSASGQIKAEGVVGIARAFLASGARAVLAALWAVEDEATMWFMNRFYEHLVHGESASESLHQAMKSMRENHFSDVMQWAPFMLIGDDVAFKGLYLISILGFLFAGAFEKSSSKDGEGATETKNL
ncbi:unnamed protein product [Porites lobata]|uniref:CHAT domain-containing protein n=1 Tax=Porites lobata TaxID=104759 RepID=A0ABN8QRK7_9CNID|nr:unnamed protein product [Porites lobata]